jgi:hypothetical protein
MKLGEFKVGDTVKAHDLSYTAVIGPDGSIRDYCDMHPSPSNDSPFMKQTPYKVVAVGVTGLKSFYNPDQKAWFGPRDNDTIVIDMKTGEVIFFVKRFLYPVEVCSVCGHTKE